MKEGRNISADVIVIGSGVNGLTAAALLAQHGLRVVVVEKNSFVGGLAASEAWGQQYVSLGVLQDQGWVRQWVVEQLHLDRFGLRIKPHRPEVLYYHAASNQCLVLGGDGQLQQQSLQQFGQHTCDAYAAYQNFVKRLSPFINHMLNQLPPNAFEHLHVSNSISFLKMGMKLRLLGKKDMYALLRFAPMCVADFVNEWLDHNFLKTALASTAVLGWPVGPWSPLTALHLLMHEAQAQRTVEGGAPKLVSALQACCQAYDVDILTNREIQGLILRSGILEGVVDQQGQRYFAGIVLASCHVQHLFNEIVPRELIPMNMTSKLRHYRCQGTAVSFDLALRKPLKLRKQIDGDHIFHYIKLIPESLDRLEQQFDAVKYGRMSSEPVIEIFQDQCGDHYFASGLLHYVAPNHLDHIDEQVIESKLKEAIDAAVQQGSWDDYVIDCRVRLMKDLQYVFNLPGGQIHHGDPAADQLYARPIPELSRYQTMLEGFYLCGASSFPGGGLTMAPGALASQYVRKRNLT